MNSLALSRLCRGVTVCRRTSSILFSRTYVTNPAETARSRKKADAGEPAGASVVDSASQPIKRRRRSANPPVLPPVKEGELPPADMWRDYYPVNNTTLYRGVVREAATAQILAEAFVPKGSKNKIIIDANPGPGQLTRALLKLPKARIKKIVVLEPENLYLSSLKPLEKEDPRIQVFPWYAKEWDTYTKLKKCGALDDVKVEPWKDEHTQLQFIMHMPSTVEGEQLLSQLLRLIPDQEWLFHYGRVPLNCIFPLKYWERLIASNEDVHRSKLAVVAQATVEMKPAIPIECLQPFENHFHPRLMQKHPSYSKAGQPHGAFTLTPLPSPFVNKGDMDAWDFIARKLFAMKATPVERALASNALGVGSENLIPKLASRRGSKRRFDVKKDARHLSTLEWKSLVEEFKNWHFRPEVLSIGNMFEDKLNVTK